MGRMGWAGCECGGDGCLMDGGSCLGVFEGVCIQWICVSLFGVCFAIRVIWGQVYFGEDVNVESVEVDNEII